MSLSPASLGAAVGCRPGLFTHAGSPVGVCWVLLCHESLLYEQCHWICLIPQHLCPELLALGVAPPQWEQAAIGEIYQIQRMQQCAAVLTVLFPRCSLCPRPLVRVDTQPAFNLEHYRDSHSGPLQYIFWRRMLRSICPGEQICVRDGCAGWWPGMLCRGKLQPVKCRAWYLHSSCPTHLRP